MAQEIMVMGAIYEDVPSVRLPDSNGTFHPFTDTSDTTAVAGDVAQGKTFHLADGTLATGTASGGGGGGGSVDPKDVNFVDYDGTIVHSYTKDEFLALTAMPENPTHAGLVSQGWNWSLADAQEYVAECGIQTIGQMYATESGATEIDIVLHEGRLSPYLSLAPNGTVTIDWGDGSTDTVTGTSTTTPINTRHDYAAAGSYTIKVSVESGRVALLGDSTHPMLNNNTTPQNTNRVYAAGVVAVRIGAGTSIGAYALQGFVNLAYVTIPNSATDFGERAFNECMKLEAITVPDGTVNIPAFFLYACYAYYISLPSSITAVAKNALASNLRIRALSIPTVESLEDNVFNNNYILSRATIPSTVASIGFTSLGGSYCMEELHFTSSTPPTLSSWSAFANLYSGCTIYVPQGSLAAYTSARNYPSPSTYTYVEE